MDIFRLKPKTPRVLKSWRQWGCALLNRRGGAPAAAANRAETSGNVCDTRYRFTIFEMYGHRPLSLPLTPRSLEHAPVAPLLKSERRCLCSHCACSGRYHDACLGSACWLPRHYSARALLQLLPQRQVRVFRQQPRSWCSFALRCDCSVGHIPNRNGNAARTHQSGKCAVGRDCTPLLSSGRASPSTTSPRCPHVFRVGRHGGGFEHAVPLAGGRWADAFARGACAARCAVIDKGRCSRAQVPHWLRAAVAVV